MVLSDDEELHERMLFLRDHGRLPGDVSFRSVEVAWKYKMSELQAALGSGPARPHRRADRAEAADLRLVRRAPRRSTRSPSTSNASGERATYWMVTAVFAEAHRRRRATRCATRSRDANIATRPFFPPLSSLPAFADSPDTTRARSRQPDQLRPGRAGDQPAVRPDPDGGPGRSGVRRAPPAYAAMSTAAAPTAKDRLADNIRRPSRTGAVVAMITQLHGVHEDDR